MNLPRLTNGQRGKMIKAIDLDSLETCDGDCQRPLTEEDRNRFPAAARL